MAFGTKTIAKVDKIVGPGNIFVATAKRLLYGTVGIDMVAGPSELLVVADDDAKPAHVAADLLCEAEHDEDAQVYLVTTSATLAKEVVRLIQVQLKGLQREKIAAKSIARHFAAFVVPTMDEAIAVANAIAPEHLTLSVDRPFDYLEQVRHAGALFLGRYTPVVGQRLREGEQHRALHQGRVDESQGSYRPTGAYRGLRCARQISPKQVRMKKNGAPRQASLHRATKETDIRVEWTLDGTGQGKVETSIRFFDHMLDLLAKHGFFDLTVQAKGDIDIDEHHTVEDVGIVMGKALNQALGEKAGIKRFGFASVPLDETLAQVTVDLSGRPYLVYNVNLPDRKIKTFDLGLFEDFFQAFVTHGGLNLHVNLQYGRNPHHIMEAIFKALARALDQATALEERLSGAVLSTKGSL